MTTWQPSGSRQDTAAQIRALRQAAEEHEHQYAALAARTRRALTAAVIDGTLCHEGAAQALYEWGLPALPSLWRLSIAATVDYRHPYSDPAAAAREAHALIHARLTEILGPAATISQPYNVKVTPAAAPVGLQPRFTVSASVRLTVAVKALNPHAALTAARGQLPAHAIAGHSPQVSLAVNHAIWSCSPPAPAVLDLDADAPPWTPPAARPATVRAATPGRLAWAHRHEAVTRTRLQRLQRAIRTRALAAARTDLGHLTDPMARVGQFLAGIGLQPAPPAWLVCVSATTILTLPATSYQDAHETVWAAAAGRAGHEQISVDDHFLADDGQWPEDGAWQGTWGETLQVWVRAADEHTAADAATRLVRAYLDALAVPQLHGHRLRVTGTVQTIDPVWDPVRD
jgi:hypothetical protein